MEMYIDKISKGLSCPECHWLFSENQPFQHQGKVVSYQNLFELYFSGEELTCIKCKNPINLFSLYYTTVKENFMLTDAFLLLGATTTSFQIVMKNNEACHIEFLDYGIPDQSTILKVNYSADGIFIPVEFRGNSPMLFTGYPDNCVTLYPVELSNSANELEKENLLTLNISITWINDFNDDFSNLLESFKNYNMREYDKCVIPAFVGTERLLESYLIHNFKKIGDNNISSKNLEKFFNDCSTSDQLNVLLPFVINTQSSIFRNFPSNIKGNLNRLRNLRNQIAHNGIPNTSISQDECAELITSAFFLYKYIRILLEEA